MAVSRTTGEFITDVVLNVLMFAFALAVIYPFVLIIARSLSSDLAIVTGRVFLYPVDLTLDGYATILKFGMLLRSFRNTVVLTAIGTVLNIVMTTVTAYPLSKKRLPARRLIMSFIVFTMFFGGGLVPLFILLRYLGILDTIWALILPGLVNTFYVILMKNFFLSIPTSLEESATIDGAGHFLIFSRVYVPLSVPVLATIVLFYAVGHWNAYMNVVFFITDTNKRTLQVVLNDLIFMTQMRSDPSQSAGLNVGLDIPNMESVKNGTIIVSIVPMLCVYPFIQRYFVTGIMLGSLKE